jgi:hypothetical protein
MEHDAGVYTQVMHRLRDIVEVVAPTYGGSLVPKNIIFEGGVWKVVWNTAKATEHSYKNAGKSHPIKFGAGDLSTPPIPPFPLATGNNDFYLKFDVDKTGIVVDGSVELTTSDPVTKVVKPTRPHGGDDNGVYKQSVGRITVSTTAPPVWIPYNTGTQLFSFIPEIEELGGGEGIFKTWTNGKDQVRTLNNAPGDGETIVKTGSTDEILFRRIGNHTGDGVSLVDTTPAGADLIKLLQVKGKDSPQQLHVALKTDGVSKWAEFRGNSKDISLSNVRKFDVDISDGFVEDLRLSGTEDWWGTIEYVHELASSTAEYWTRMFHKFESGVLVEVRQGTTSGGINVVPGTQAAPGAYTFHIPQ